MLKMFSVNAVPNKYIPDVVALDVLYPQVDSKAVQQHAQLDGLSRQLRMLYTNDLEEWQVELMCLKVMFEKCTHPDHIGLFKQYAPTVKPAKWSLAHIYRFVREGISYALSARSSLPFLECLHSMTPKLSAGDAKTLYEHAQHMKSTTRDDDVDDDDDYEVWQPYNEYISKLQDMCHGDESALSTPQKKKLKYDGGSPDSVMASSQRSAARKSSSKKKRVAEVDEDDDGNEASSSLQSQKSSATKARGKRTSKKQKETPVVTDAEGFIVSRRRASQA
jgi:hypothetical protein